MIMMGKHIVYCEHDKNGRVIYTKDSNGYE